MRPVSVKVCKVEMISEMDKYIQNMYTEYAHVGITPTVSRQQGCQPLKEGVLTTVWLPHTDLVVGLNQMLHGGWKRVPHWAPQGTGWAFPTHGQWGSWPHPHFCSAALPSPSVPALLGWRAGRKC